MLEYSYCVMLQCSRRRRPCCHGVWSSVALESGVLRFCCHKVWYYVALKSGSQLPLSLLLCCKSCFLLLRILAFWCYTVVCSVSMEYYVLLPKELGVLLPWSQFLCCYGVWGSVAMKSGVSLPWSLVLCCHGILFSFSLLLWSLEVCCHGVFCPDAAESCVPLPWNLVCCCYGIVCSVAMEFRVILGLFPDRLVYG